MVLIFRISDSELCQSCPNLENIEHGNLRVQGIPESIELSGYKVY